MRRFFFALPLLLVPSLALAQGLGDAAARERQKRETGSHRGKAQARVITNDDLSKPGDASASAAAPAPATEGGASGESTWKDPDQRPNQGGGEDAAQAELAQAEAQVEGARAAVVAAEERVKELSDKLNPMSPSFIYGGTRGGDVVAEEAQTREELKQAEAQLADARAALVSATQARDNLRTRRPAAPE